MIEKPTVKELLEHAENRYSLVIATAKRARQIAKGDEAKVESNEKSPVTLAANEIAERKVKIYDENGECEDKYPELEEEENTEEVQEVTEENLEENIEE